MEVSMVALLFGAGYLVSRLRKQHVIAGAGDDMDGGTPAGDRPSQQSVYHSTHTASVLADEQRRATSLAAKAMRPEQTGVVPRYERSAPRPEMNEERYASILGTDLPLEHFQHNNMVPFYRGSAGARQPLKDDAYTAKLEAFTGAFELRPQGKKHAEPVLFKLTPQGPMTSGGRPVAMYDRERELETMPQSRNHANEKPFPTMIVGRPGIQGGATGDVYYDMRASVTPPTVDQLRAGSNPRETFEGRVLPGQAIGMAPGRGGSLALPSVQPQRYPSLVKQMTGVDDLMRTTGAVTGETQRPGDLRDLRVTQRQRTAPQTYVGPAGGGGAAVQRGTVEGGAAFEPPTRSTLRAPPVGGATAAGTGGARAADYGRSSVQVYSNNRDVTTVHTHNGSLSTLVKAMVAPLQDMVRTTRKEGMVDAERAFGNASVDVPKLTVYDSSDVLRTTIRQTTSCVELGSGGSMRPAGAPRPTVYFDPDEAAARTSRGETTLSAAPMTNLRGGAMRGQAYDADDVARTSRGETTLSAAPMANLRGGAMRGQAYDADDVARTSRGETTLSAAPMANLRGGAMRGQAYDADDVARTSRGETTLSAVPHANLRGGAMRTAVYNTDDVARTTLRETMGDAGSEASRNLMGVGCAAPTVYDPTTWQPDVTRRQVTTERAAAGPPGSAAARGSVGTSAHLVGGYTSSEYYAKTTMRQVADELGGTEYGGAAGEAHGGYTVAPTDLRDTQRQTQSDLDYYGGGSGGAEGLAAFTSQESAMNMTVHDDRQDILNALSGRAPTNSAVKVAAGVREIGTVVMNHAATVDNRAPSPGRQAALPSRMLDAEGVLAGRSVVVRSDLAERGASPPPTRLHDTVQAAQTQLSGNPFALHGNDLWQQ